MKFLLIDDDASLRGLIRRLLIKAWPMAVIDVFDPTRSGKPDRDFPWTNYDVVLLDYDFGMDHLNGLDVLVDIKSEGEGPIVIMVTSQESVSLAVKAMQKGAHGRASRR